MRENATTNDYLLEKIKKITVPPVNLKFKYYRVYKVKPGEKWVSAGILTRCVSKGSRFWGAEDVYGNTDEFTRRRDALRFLHNSLMRALDNGYG